MPKYYIYEPWTAPLAVQKKANCIIGVDYPRPSKYYFCCIVCVYVAVHEGCNDFEQSLVGKIFIHGKSVAVLNSCRPLHCQQGMPREDGHCLFTEPFASSTVRKQYDAQEKAWC